MILASLYVMQGGDRDEEIDFSRIPGCPDMVRVSYTPRDDKGKTYGFVLSRSKVEEYLYDLLDLLRYDVYPYDNVQVMTKHMPSVVVSMVDLEDDSARSLVARTVLSAIDANVKRIADE